MSRGLAKPLAHAAPDTVFAPAALEVVDLRLALGRTEILGGVSLRVEQGERVALIGPNGAGKSSLFDLVSGRRKPSSGEIWLAGRRVDGWTPDRLHRAGLARSFQITNVFASLTVRHNLEAAVLAAKLAPGVFWRPLSRMHGIHRRVNALLDRLGLAHRAAVKAGELSYAEQRALELGLAVAGEADMLLLDEPTAGMSISESQNFVELIRHVAEGRSLLLIEHDMDVVFGLADRVAVLVQGTVMAFDTPARIRANPRVHAAYLAGVSSLDAMTGEQGA